MDWLMRRLFSFHPMMPEEDASVAGDAGVVASDAPVIEGVPGEATPPAAPSAPAQPIESLMLDGIKKSLAPADPEAEKKALYGAAAASSKKKVDDAFTASLVGKTPEEVTAATAAREAEAKKKSDADELAKLKGKKADDFLLTPEEKKAATQGMQQRIHQLHRYAKEQEGAVARLTEQNTTIAQARDEIMGIFADHSVEPEDLSVLLDYNKRVKTGDLPGALKIIEDARGAILVAMGKEAPGVDLLAEFPDLQQRVTDQQISRQDALELANGRRRAQAQEQARGQQNQQERSAQATKQAQDDALSTIAAWEAKMAKEDIDYKKKLEKVAAKIPGITKRYQPQQWLSAMQDIYEAIEVVKEAPAASGAPLRPSGARPGAKAFTELTPDALRAGLGYPPA